MQVSLVVCLLATLVCTGCVDAHVEKVFGILNRLLNEREVSFCAYSHGPTKIAVLMARVNLLVRIM